MQFAGHVLVKQGFLRKQDLDSCHESALRITSPLKAKGSSSNEADWLRVSKRNWRILARCRAMVWAPSLLSSELLLGPLLATSMATLDAKKISSWPVRIYGGARFVSYSYVHKVGNRKLNFARPWPKE